MATIVLYSVAYRGDVLPLAPIGWELSRRGHDVRFVCPNELHPLVGGPGITTYDADEGDLSPTGLDSHGAYIERWGTRLGGAMTVKLYVRDLCATRLAQLTAAVDAALDGADLLIAHPAATLVGRIPAEARGIPWVVADMLPGLIPTADRPPKGFHLPAWSPRLNRATWRQAARIAGVLGGEELFLAARRERGLPAERGYVFNGRISPLLHLGLASAHYSPEPSDLPSYRSCGFSSWTEPDDPLPDDVRAYLEDGDPPVLVTLGTSAASAADAVFGRAAEALDDLGLRAIFVTGNEANAASVRGRPGVWSFVPLGPVLARCRAALQSGAHGTNALVLAAGIPSAVVPLLFDQVWNGSRNIELGLGTMVRRPSVSRLRAALEQVTSDPGLARSATSFAELLAGEHGPTTAADEIEALLAARG